MLYVRARPGRDVLTCEVPEISAGAAEMMHVVSVVNGPMERCLGGDSTGLPNSLDT